MHPFLRLIYYSCLAGAILLPVDSIKAQSWEYALTEAEYEGSEFFDVLALDSQIIVAGARNSCHLPALWVFDRQGNLLQFKDLTPALDSGFLYGYGKVMQLRYNDERKEIEAIGQVLLADDVPAGGYFIWILNDQLEIIRTYDPYRYSENPSGTIQFATQGFNIFNNQGDFWLLNSDFAILKHLKLPTTSDSGIAGISHNDTIYTYLSTSQGQPYVEFTIYTLDGDTVAHQQMAPFIQIELINPYLYTLGKDLVIRRYDKSSLSFQDSISLDHQKLVLQSQAEQLIAIGYDQSSFANIYILDKLFNIEHQVSTLRGENHIIATIEEMDLIWVGSYYDTRSEYGWIQQGIIPFLRNKKLADGDSIRRPSLVILDAEVLNVVEANAYCEYFPPGDTLCFYSGDEPTYFKLTIKNTGNDTIWSLGYHSQILGAINCAREYNYRYLENIEILPGETVIVQDSFYLSGPQFVDTMFFYVVGPNHRLHSAPNEFAVLDLILSDQHLSDRPPLKIYPNPARDWIQLDDDTPPDQVRVVNTLGQVFFAGTLTSGTLDVSQWPAGQYFITASVRQHNYQGIFVKL